MRELIAPFLLLSKHVSLPQFLTDLFEHGRVRVSQPDGGPAVGELLAIDSILAAQEAHVRSEFPGEAPAWLPAAGRWSAVMLYRGCQLAVHRELVVEQVVGQAAPEPPAAGACPASRHYSVDVVFRFLPDLERLVQTAAKQDPLLDQIKAWGQDWPLSSVGMKCIVAARVDELIGHPGMLRYYADRVMARRDASRMDHEQVRSAVRQALGMYDSIAPEVAPRCKTVEPGIRP